MTTLVVHHHVRDFDTWKPVFDRHAAARRQHGCTRHSVYRSTEDPNDVVVALDFPSPGAAREFLEDPGLRETMARAGVDGEPDIHMREPVEEIMY